MNQRFRQWRRGFDKLTHRSKKEPVPELAACPPMAGRPMPEFSLYWACHSIEVSKALFWGALFVICDSVEWIWKHGCSNETLSLTQPFCSFFACPKKERKKGPQQRQPPWVVFTHACPNKGPTLGRFAPLLDLHALLARRCRDWKIVFNGGIALRRWAS